MPTERAHDESPENARIKESSQYFRKMEYLIELYVFSFLLRQAREISGVIFALFQTLSTVFSHRG